MTTTIEGAVLFSDLVGFTEFNGAMGDHAAIEVLDRHRAAMDASVDGVVGARVVKELGDGLLVWASSAGDGVQVATSFLAAIQRERADRGFPLAVRVGVHHGGVLERGDDVVGQTVNVASRIVDLAGPGEILVSDEVIDGCGSVVTFAVQPVGPVAVKGVERAVWLHRVEVLDRSVGQL